MIDSMLPKYCDKTKKYVVEILAAAVGKFILNWLIGINNRYNCA